MAFPDQETRGRSVEEFIQREKQSGRILRLIHQDPDPGWYSFFKGQLQPGELLTLVIVDNETGQCYSKKFFNPEDLQKIIDEVRAHHETNEHVSKGWVVGVYVVKNAE